MKQSNALTPAILGCVLLAALIGAMLASRPVSRLDETMAKAGSNALELRKALAWAEEQGEPAHVGMKFLIENMVDHSYYEIMFADSFGRRIDFDASHYADYESARAVVDSIDSSWGGKLGYRRGLVVEDARRLTAAELIQNMQAALAVRDFPWTRHISDADWMELVLPYRGSNEPVEAWREALRDTLLPKLEAAEIMGAVEAATLVNDWAARAFTFNPKYYLHPTDQGYAEMCQTGLGRCEDMTNFSIYAMRSVGLAVTSDYTPYWADSGNNHAWNALLGEGGRVIPFMGCEAHPGSYSLRERIAKVYRKTFGRQEDCLAVIKHEDEELPAWLAGRHYVDVTRDYVTTRDVSLPLMDPQQPTAYLCVFNDGKWCAIDWARPNELGHFTFEDMGCNLIYLPAWYHKGEIKPAFKPILLEAEGWRYLGGEGEKSVLDLNQVTARVTAEATDHSAAADLTANHEYELFWWNGMEKEWSSAGKQVAGTDSMSFADVPADALFWLVDNTVDRKEERIFLVEDGRQVWY